MSATHVFEEDKQDEIYQELDNMLAGITTIGTILVATVDSTIFHDESGELENLLTSALTAKARTEGFRCDNGTINMGVCRVELSYNLDANQIEASFQKGQPHAHGCGTTVREALLALVEDMKSDSASKSARNTHEELSKELVALEANPHVYVHKPTLEPAHPTLSLLCAIPASLLWRGAPLIRNGVRGTLTHLTDTAWVVIADQNDDGEGPPPDLSAGEQIVGKPNTAVGHAGWELDLLEIPALQRLARWMIFERPRTSTWIATEPTCRNAQLIGDEVERAANWALLGLPMRARHADLLKRFMDAWVREAALAGVSALAEVVGD